MVDELTKSKIKGLLLKNFNQDEIANLLNISKEDINKVQKEIGKMPIQQNTSELYNELQKDLSKLVITELNKSNRDSNVVLNAIKLQVEIQEKKLNLQKGKSTPDKISKDYIYERDEKMAAMAKSGAQIPDIAKQFGVSNLSVRNAIDRCSLDLPEELKTLPPTIVAETDFTGIDKSTRLKVLWEAYNNKLTRHQVRQMMIKIKGEVRKSK